MIKCILLVDFRIPVDICDNSWICRQWW